MEVASAARPSSANTGNAGEPRAGQGPLRGDQRTLDRQPVATRPNGKPTPDEHATVTTIVSIPTTAVSTTVAANKTRTALSHADITVSSQALPDFIVAARRCFPNLHSSVLDESGQPLVQEDERFAAEVHHFEQEHKKQIAILEARADEARQALAAEHRIKRRRYEADLAGVFVAIGEALAPKK